MATISQLLQLANNPNQPPLVQKGSIVAFSYLGQTGNLIHDPAPLVLVTNDPREVQVKGCKDCLRGLNLHYLTLPYLQNLMKVALNLNFNILSLKADRFLMSAFRSYKRRGIVNLRLIDTGFIKNLFKVARAADISEIEAMRAQVRQMIAQQENQPSAAEAVGQPVVQK